MGIIKTKINQNLQKFQNFLKKLASDESGSAIILALIIIAGLAGTGIGAARLAKSNTQQASIYEDSLKAFYAAEAGIEAGMLEWRFDHNVEFWNQQMALKCFNDNDEKACEAATVKKVVKLGQVQESGDVFGTGTAENISECFDEYNGGFVAGSGCGQTGLPRNEAWYEMEISYRNPKYPYLGKWEFAPSDLSDCNNFCELTDNDLVRIAKDQSLEVSFPKSDGVRKFDIHWNADLKSAGTYSMLLVHPVVTDETGADLIVPEEYVSGGKYFTDYRDISSSYATTAESIYQVNLDNNPNNYLGINSVRIKCLSTDSEGGCYVGIKANKSAASGGELVFMPQKEVVMKVTGHFNDVERTLEYKIDRQSGTIMDIFDHGVYSKETLRK